MKRWWKWLAIVGGVLAAVFGGILALGRRKQLGPLPDGLRDELDDVLDDHVDAIDAEHQAAVDAARATAWHDLDSADAALEEHANEPATDDHADWCRPSRRRDD